VLYSCEEGVAKPDPRAFVRAIARCPVDAPRVRYLDDRPENVQVARDAGLDARHVWDQETVVANLDSLLSGG